MPAIQLTLPRIGQVLPADAEGDIDYETEDFIMSVSKTHLSLPAVRALTGV